MSVLKLPPVIVILAFGAILGQVLLPAVVTCPTNVGVAPFNCPTVTASLSAVPSAKLVILAFVLPVLLVARFKFPSLSTDNPKSLELATPLFNFNVSNFGSFLNPTVTIGASAVPPIWVERFSPKYLTVLFELSKSPDCTLKVAPGFVVILFPTSASTFGAAFFNCATVTASSSLAPSASWLILLSPTETTFPLSANAWFVKYPAPSDLLTVTPCPNATEFAKLAVEFAPKTVVLSADAVDCLPNIDDCFPVTSESAPATVPPAAYDLDPDPNTTLAEASFFSDTVPLAAVCNSPTVAPLPIATE